MTTRSEQGHLRRAADTLTGLRFETWSFGDSVGFEAMVAASDHLGDPSYAGFAHGFFRSWATRAEPYRLLDCTAPGRAICHVAGATGDAMLVDAAVRLADFLADRPRVAGVFATWEQSPLQDPAGPDQLPPDEAALLAEPGPGVFVDCLHFDPPFFAALASLTGEGRFSELALEQAVGYVDLLQDDETGLFHHFFLARTGRRYIPGWSRGQGWALLGLLEVIESLPATDERLARLRRSAARLIDAMLVLQREDGHWNAVAHEPESGDESSTAAFMVTGLARACRLGVVPCDRVAEPARRARAAMLASTDERGLLRGVSAAVGACTQPSHYRDVPRGFTVPWGQGPLVLALCEPLP